MQKKKILALLLAALLTAPTLVACSEGETETGTTTTDTTNTADTEVVETETETTRAQIQDNLPDKDFDGANFHLLTRERFYDDFMPEELTGEVLNDTLYARNSKIMETYNVTLSYTAPACDWYAPAMAWNKTLETSVMAGDGAYDLVAGYAAAMPYIVPKGILLNWHDVPHIDLTQPWWSEKVSDALTVNGNLFLLTGDYSLSLWDNMYSFLFDKQVALDYNIEDLYSLVREGGWTMDKLQELANIVSHDANGDGKWNENDVYGLISNFSTAIDTFQIACQMDIISHTDDGGLEVTLLSEKAVDIVEKVVKLYNDSHGAYMKDEDLNGLNNMFTSDQALFYATYFDTISELRSMETDFGILPYPKLNEAQAHYASTSRDNFDLFVLPLDIKDPEMSGIITEAMCAESYRTVVPAYYDVVLKSKSSRDEESAEMIDLIRDSLTFDFGYLCSSSLKDVGHIFVGLVRKNKTDLASNYAAGESATQAALDEMLAAYGYEK